MSFIREKYEQWVQANYSLHQVGDACWQYRPTTKLAKKLETLKLITSVFTLVTSTLLVFLSPLSIIYAVFAPNLRLAVADRLFISQPWIWPLLATLIAGLGINLPIFALQEPIPPSQCYRYKSLLSLLMKRLFDKNRGRVPVEYARVNFAGVIIPVALALYQLKFSSPIVIGVMTTVVAVISYGLSSVIIQRGQHNAINRYANIEEMIVSQEDQSRVDAEGIRSVVTQSFSSGMETVSLAAIILLVCVVTISLILSFLPQPLVGDRAVSIAFSSFALSGVITGTILQARPLLSWKSNPENPTRRPPLLIGGVITLPGYIACSFLSAEWIPNAVDFLLSPF